jgi:hypothetical protein
VYLNACHHRKVSLVRVDALLNEVLKVLAAAAAAAAGATAIG